MPNELDANETCSVYLSVSLSSSPLAVSQISVANYEAQVCAGETGRERPLLQEIMATFSTGEGQAKTSDTQVTGPSPYSSSLGFQLTLM